MAHSFSHFSDKTSLLRLSDLLLAIIGQAEGFLEKKNGFWNEKLQWSEKVWCEFTIVGVCEELFEKNDFIH